jgi:hypothetical protein
VATQRIIWTVLPNGKEGSARKLSVLVSPRLETAGQTTLDAFGDFRGWPGKALTFTLKFETEPPGTSKVVTVSAPPGPPERADLWQAAFPKQTTVEGHEFPDYSGLAVNSMPVLNVLSFIGGQYKKVASAVNTAGHFPHVDQLTGAGGLQQIAFGWNLIGKTARPRDGDPEVANQLRQLLRKNKAVPPAAPNPPLDFWQVKELVRPRNATKQITLSGGYKAKEYVQFFPAQVPKPDIDFHKAVALLGDHPKLLRALGLIVDLEVTESVPASGFVWVEDVQADPAWELEPVHVRPKTRYTTDFLAQAESQALGKGFLTVDKGYGLVEVDVQGAALKLMNLANTVLASLHPARNTADTSSRFSLPALRSGGLQLVRTGRAANLVSRLSRSKALNSDAVKATPAQSKLFAEDVVRGYAADVKDASDAANPWHSLCLRRVSYALGKPGSQKHWPPDPTKKLDDEGWTSLGTTSGPDRSTSPDLTLTEEMFRWDGWSLCARRPGKSVGTNDKPADFANEPDEVQVVVDAEVMPGSLPRLRFGREYLVRARAVDLAGNSLPHSYDGPDSKIGPKLYSRFEPIAHPAVVPQSKSGPGESLQRLVIRSFNDTPAKDTVKTAEQTGRHVAPPLGSALLAEAHGKLDTMTPAQSYALTTSRQGSYEDPDDPTAAEVPHSETQLALPYLPDPLGHGVSFLGLPLDEIDRFLGLPGAPLNKEIEYHADGSSTVTDLNPTEKPPISLIQVDFGPIDAWPDLQTFTVLVVEGTAEPAWDQNTRRLTVFVPKAETARVRVSSYIGDEAFPLLGIWQWIEDTKPAPAVKKRLQRLALQGRHWMLTPFRELVFVHAVQQPMLIPDISKLAATRDIGSTAAVLSDNVGVHAKSTGKLDLDAEWTEPVDPLTETKPRSISGRAHAFEVPIRYPGLPEQPSDDIVSVAHRHELGDTKHREITYRAVASTRYREYFDDDTLDFTRTTQDVTLHVPSSARPEAPRVLYVVPTFGWERPPVSAREMRSTRSGGGLRVYLERPWYSSGDEEMLGVLLPETVPQRGGGGRKVGAKIAPTIPDELKPYVSQWGGDPIAGSPVAKPLLGPADFPRLKEQRAKLTLEEIDKHTVRVAAHAVEYDERRQLWYSDIELNPGPAYFPFVRLALARYQPWSVEVPAARNQPLQNVHLSRVVLAEFTQLTPDRTATVTTESDTRLAVAVAGVGVHGNTVDVRVETQRHDLPTDLGWVPAQNARVDELLTAVARGPRRFEVTLPAPRGSMPLRLVIREYEEYPSSFEGKEKTLSRRLVYAEVFEL